MTDFKNFSSLKLQKTNKIIFYLLDNFLLNCENIYKQGGKTMDDFEKQCLIMNFYRNEDYWVRKFEELTVLKSKLADEKQKNIRYESTIAHILNLIDPHLYLESLDEKIFTDIGRECLIDSIRSICKKALRDV